MSRSRALSRDAHARRIVVHMKPTALAFAFCVAPLVARAQSTPYDILIRNGTAVLGNGQAPRQTDIGIRGDRIAFVGTAPADAPARRIIDARGLTVAPGFIDPHTHTGGDLSSAQSRAGVPNRANLPYLMQGVTTVITNNDGGGPVDIARQLEGWTRNGIGTNAAVYVGQGSIRGAAIGSTSAAATPGSSTR